MLSPCFTWSAEGGPAEATLRRSEEYTQTSDVGHVVVTPRYGLGAAMFPRGGSTRLVVTQGDRMREYARGEPLLQVVFGVSLGLRVDIGPAGG